MATRILGPTGSRRRRRFLLVPILLVSLAAFFVIAGAQANPPEQSGFFELDKNAQNNLSTTLLGSLGGNINATTNSFTVCQASATNPSPLPITIQVDAEQMTVGAIASANGGGCSGAFKRTYSSVTRGVNGTTGASHSGSGVQANVTQLVTGTVPGDDWSQVYAAVLANGHPTTAEPNPCSGAAWTGGSAITACDWENDPPNATVFTTGGSKDDLDINVGTPPNVTHNWQYTNSSVPDADDITNGFAAKYVDPAPGGHEFLFFGADRTAVNGAKDMGFWFFKSPVSLNADGTFSGQHTVGDILLLGTFTNGGAATNIRVFSWVGSGGDTNGVLQSGGSFGDCVPGGSGSGCNTVNNSTVTSPWPYQSKISGTPANTLYAGALMEGGVDLTALGLEGCFSNFMAETRSSPEIGAQLKDFLLGNFEVCRSSLTTTPADSGGTPLTDHDGDGIPDAQLGTGSAGVNVTDSANLTINGTNTWSGTLHFFLCGPIATGTCDTGGTEIGSGTAVNQDTTMPVVSATANITSVGRYCWRGFFDSSTSGVDDNTDASLGECFEVLPVTPAVTTDATDAVEVGNPIDDTAHLTGTANRHGTPVINPTTPGAPAGGTITFRLYGPSGTTPDCSSNKLVATRVVNVSGDGFYNASDGTGDSLTPSAPGTYYWTATYSGDDPNTLGANTSCGDANESSRVVDARISIAPDDTNEVGVPHTFIVHVEATDASGTFQPVQGVNPVVTLTPSNGASDPVLGVTDGCAANGTDASGNCSVTFHSDTAGKVTGHASITLSVAGVSLTRATDGTHGSSNDAVKTYVDAFIAVSPLTDTNEVNDPHTITATVKQDTGAGVGFVNAPDGTLVTFSLLNNGAGAAFVGGVNTCHTTAGQCSVQINTSTPGSVDIHATTTFDVGGVSLTRATGTGGNNSADANKVYVDAFITIAPDDTNEVGVEHTFTVHIESAAASGTFQPVQGLNPVVTLTPSNGASVLGVTDHCADTGTNANGDCTVTFHSDTAGKVTGHASITFDVGGVSLTRATDGTHGSSNDAVKTYVDAFIAVSPLTDTNEVNDPHTITATVKQDSGNGAGFVNAPDGTLVTFSLLNNSAGAAFVGGVNTCNTTGGQCSVQINTSTAGSVDIHATTTFSVGGVSLTRATGTGGNNSADANKVYVDAYITINPPEATNIVNETHTLTVFVAQDDGLPAGPPGDNADGFGPAPAGTPVTVTLTNHDGAEYQLIEDNCAFPGLDGNGMCTVKFTSPKPGTVTAHAAVTFDVGGVSLHRETDGNAPNSGDAIKHFIGTSSSTTAQDWLPNDTATITGDSNLNGTLTFQLYTGDNCGATSGSAVPGQSYSFTLTNVPSPATRSTTNGSDPNNTFKVKDANQGAYSWLVHYDDANLTDPPDKCETSTVSITD